MSLTNLSKVTTSGIATGTSLLITNVSSSGVVTAASFSGPLSGDATGLSGTPNITVGVVTASSVTISGDLTVEGTYSTLDTILTEVDKLEVAANNSTVGVAITQSGTGDILRLYDGATQAVTVTDGGNFGIGTASPQFELDVNGRGRFQGSTSSATSGSGLELAYVSGSTTGSVVTYNRSTNTYLTTNVIGNPLTFSIGATEKARITSTGNVGIGTTNPATNFKLDVNGDLSLGEYNGSDNTYIDQKQNGHLNIINSGVPGNTGAVRINKTNTIGGDTTYFRDFVVYDGKNNVVQFIDGSSGNVGIGTDNPRSKLDINGTDSELRFYRDAGDRFGGLRYTGSKLTLKLPTSDHFVVDDATGIERVRITSTGSVGIGTDDPDNKLHVMGNVQVGKTEINGYETIISTNGVQFNRSSSSYIDQLGSGNLRFRYGAGYDIWMHMVGSTGNVGIGTDTPDKKLRVEGDARITGTLTMGTASVSIDGTVEYPSIRPTLDLNFAGTKVLDDRITFYRDSVGTYIDEDGLVKYASNNTPRFDHDPATGESLGLLIEESRTNFITNSETPLSAQGSNLTSSYLTVSAVSNVVSPDGTTNGVVRYTTNASGSGAYRFGNTTDGIAETTYTGSIWIKSATGSDESMNIDVNDRGALVFTATTEWRRVSVSAAREGAFTHRFMDINSGPSKDFYIWGPQLELGSFPTSYIPTSGTTVTRAEDYAKITGTNFTDFYNATEGTLFAESSIADLTTANQGTVQLWYSGTDHIGMGYRWGGSGSGTYGFYIRNTSDELYRAPSGVTANTFVKASLAYKSGDGASSLNGETAYPDTSINLPTAATEMTIGYGNASPSTYRMKQGHIKSLKYYNKRLPNAQLQGLTQQ